MISCPPPSGFQPSYFQTLYSCHISSFLLAQSTIFCTIPRFGDNLLFGLFRHSLLAASCILAYRELITGARRHLQPEVLLLPLRNNHLRCTLLLLHLWLAACPGGGKAGPLVEFQVLRAHCCREFESLGIGFVGSSGALMSLLVRLCPLLRGAG